MGFNYNPLNVVITGGTKGLGRALSREFLRQGDRVFISSRSIYNITETTRKIRDQVGIDEYEDRIYGKSCEVSDYHALVKFAKRAETFHENHIDIWINNAGYSGGQSSLLEIDPERIKKIIDTNLLGSIYSTRVAIETMQKQEKPGHIFNLEGAGSDGFPTPNFSTYGATKIAIKHFVKSLFHEIETENLIGLHTISPGMILTNLLLEGATPQQKQFFNILCEFPETVAEDLVPKIKDVVSKEDKHSKIVYLTWFMILKKFMMFNKNKGRFFDKDGKRLYLSEKVRNKKI